MPAETSAALISVTRVPSPPTNEYGSGPSNASRTAWGGSACERPSMTALSETTTGFPDFAGRSSWRQFLLGTARAAVE